MLINKPLILSTGTGVAPAYTIDQSIRFNDGDSAYMHRTPSGAGDRRTFTYSLWFKLGDMATSQRMLLSVRNSDTTRDNIMINQGNAGDYRIYFDARVSGSAHTELEPTRALRDSSAWYHLVVSVDTTNAVSTERVRLYLNGARETAFTTQTFPSLNQQFQINNTDKHSIGRFEFSSPQSYWDGYMAEMVMIDGQALDPSSFGEYNSSNIWIPKDVSGLTFGTNGFHIDGRDSADLGDDESGNGNDFTTSGLASHDQVADTPTNNFCVMNAIENVPCTFSQGNLTIDSTANFTGNAIRGNIHIKGGSTGKWYYEVIGSLTGDYFSTGWQLSSIITPSGSVIGQSDSGAIGFYNTGSYQNASSVQGVITKPAAGDVIGVALDASTGEVFLRDDSGYFVGTLTSNALSSGVVITGFSGEDLAIVARNSSSGTATYNFGQDGTFAGVKTAGGNTDANGIGNFFYTVPDGYLAICTKNLGS